MFTRIVVRLVVWLLDKANLTIDQRNLLTGKLLDTMGSSTPLRDIIRIDEEGTLLVKGSPLTPYEARQYLEGAKSALNNATLQLIWDQIRYECFKGGVSNGAKPEDILFYRTALWNGERERFYLSLFEGNTDGN